ncbi:MAG: DUF3153 domain-containing protein [Cyanobium sp.]
MADPSIEPQPSDPSELPPEQLAASLAGAQALLERGEYGRVLGMLEPLVAGHAAATAAGAELRVLMATALLGQGRSEEAAQCCRALRGNPDPELRERVRALQQILEAPVLERPRDWSISLPELGDGIQIETIAAASQIRRSRRPPPPSPPPVGPTQGPYGFAALAGVLLTLMLLASLLGGCVEVRTTLRFAAPGRLQISQEVASATGVPGPWQRRLPSLLAPHGFREHSHQGGVTRLEGGVLPAAAALDALRMSFLEGAALADLELQPPSISWQERNWLLGVRQRLSLSIDLRSLPAMPRLSLIVALEPLGRGSLERAHPLQPQWSSPGRLIWRLQPGQINSLEIHGWRWSPLGLGAAGIALALPLVLALQRLRLLLGFGLPELPA